jgi:nucleoside-diphosphate-sugar epimerase
MNQTTVVTGGAGFIGSHLCDYFINKGNKVICLDNLLTGQKKNIAQLLNNPNFHFLEADVVKQSTIKKIESLITHYSLLITDILHFASPAGPHPTYPLSYFKLPIKTYLVNSIGTHYLLELARKHKATFLFASTSEVYGDPIEHPQNESYLGNVNTLGPRACYDESKRFGEMATYTFFKKYKLNAKIVRIFNTFGPKMNPKDGRAIPVFITQALKNAPITIFGTGKQTRSFCYIDDLTDGIIKTIEKGKPGEAYNLGSADEKSINETVEIILNSTKSQSKVVYRPGIKDDPKRRCPDISKAKKKLGWSPKVDFQQGLKKTIEYFKK